MMITLSWWQLLLGTSFALLEATSAPISCHTPHWLSSIRQFMAKLDASLHNENLQNNFPQPLRAHDVALVDAINSLPNLKNPQKVAFNRCRIYLGVTFLSEIATADRIGLARDAWDGTRPRITSLLWPHQPHVGPQTLQTWRRLLATAFLNGTRTRVSASTRDLTLCHRLGCWLPSSDGFRLHWDCFFSATTTNLYRRQPDSPDYDVYASRKTRRRPKHPVRSFNKDKTGTSASLPPDAVPTEWRYEPNRIVIPSVVSQVQAVPDTPAPPMRWADYIATLPNWEQLLLQHVQFVDRAQLLVNRRTAPLLLLASDGAAHALQGSFGCLLATLDTILLDCGGRAYGADPWSGTCMVPAYWLPATGRATGTWYRSVVRARTSTDRCVAYIGYK
jgi:hypothetical protein